MMHKTAANAVVDWVVINAISKIIVFYSIVLKLLNIKFKLIPITKTDPNAPGSNIKPQFL